VDEIKAAYRRKARECHPDHGGSDDAMVRLIEARDALFLELGL
jgi:curved DNA-binding protein CbpA